MSTLYVVATPIGNLEDITGRALKVLEQVDLIACEDTRKTAQLLNHYGIKAAKVAYHAHNQKKSAEGLVKFLDQGKSLALVSDGGTPSISDPGPFLVRLARERGHRAVPIPGPSALSALLSIAGTPCAGVTFEGFLSPRPGKRKKRLLELLQVKGGAILFESPHKILKLLALLEDMAPDRRILVGR